MIAPNKVVSLEESALGLTPAILAEGPVTISVAELFQRVSPQADGVDQFMLALDILFVLGRISVDRDSRQVIYAP